MFVCACVESRTQVVMMSMEAFEVRAVFRREQSAETATEKEFVLSQCACVLRA